MGELTFLHPALLAGLAGAALPVLIHLIGKRRASSIRFAAFDFLLAVNERLARRERLRQLLLLLFRTLAVVAMVLAVARPEPRRAAAAVSASRRVALVLDASASMAYVRDGRTLLERGKDLARQALSHLQSGDAATLVVAGREVRPLFQAPTLELASVRAALDSVTEPAGVADLGGAIELALSQLGEDGSGATLVVVSDLSTNSFASLRPTALDPPPEVRLLDAAERAAPTPLPNLAIERISVESTGEAPSERRVRVTVRNYGAEAVTGRPLELSIGDVVTHRGFLDVGARASQDKVLTHTFEGAGVYRATARLMGDDDGYPRDDVLSVVVEVSAAVRVLAVNGDPRTTPYDDELFFLERALVAVPKGEPPIVLTIVTMDELGGADAFEGYDVVVLANAPELPEPLVSQLRTRVQRGTGLLFTLGDRVLFERANQRFGDLLPHALRDLHKAADEVAGTPPLAIRDIDTYHPALAGLGTQLEDGLRASRTSRYFNLDVGSGLKALAVLRFDNGAPALVERRGGGGRVMMLTTSVDVDMTDLPLRSVFPPLLQRTVRYLARAVGVAGVAAVRAGEKVSIPVPTGAGALALVAPSGARSELELGEERSVELGPLQEVGVHEVQVRGAQWAREPRLDVAVGPSLAESDFAPVQPARVAEELGGGQAHRAVAVSLGGGQHEDPFAQRGWVTYLLLALCLFFLSESLLASRG